MRMLNGIFAQWLRELLNRIGAAECDDHLASMYGSTFRTERVKDECIYGIRRRNMEAGSLATNRSCC